ncbi:LEAF RUST 10 DISEASE-RESISTANCE LOCUS RECEPTOR-LIKE PROTEIN KINASE-like 2.2 [Arachis duranensis]|uniref:LEAF RUST 10 DISEASE-RESISTANCE LOCUS RECEPTOR-LIKE PROTEIN KINASE-like 2.2 n=1 Tax=Arachis duranensis TaxID=130453 RepID=A0A9C6TS55_ARADU|nr:LEAF RUST 10 DISEASE-RESISTANCE LOCUS RECEPTOR-LIKE PROTEIN KINASE-like 2.2 [Arachis duranensis]
MTLAFLEGNPSVNKCKDNFVLTVLNKGRKAFSISYFCCFLLHFLLTITVTCAADHSKTCAPSSCGKVTDIRHPFRRKDDPENCGDRRYELTCENNVTVLALFPGKNYHVESINYNNFTIRLVDPSMDSSEDHNCSTLPRYSITRTNFSNTETEPYVYEARQVRETLLKNGGMVRETLQSFEHVVFLKCRNPVRDDPRHVDTAPCIKEGGNNVYAVVGGLPVVELRDDCDVKLVAASSLLSVSMNQNFSYADIRRMLAYGFEVSWIPGACEYQCGQNNRVCVIDGIFQSLKCNYTGVCFTPLLKNYCGLRKVVGKDSTGDYFYQIIKTDVFRKCILKMGVFTGWFMVPYMVVKFILSLAFFLVLLIYSYQRRHASICDNIEEFLQGNKLIPIRYSYKEIKKMARGFKEKLGEGGFGSVHKGKLRSGPFVAIKMLGKAKGNGQDFISEVATIGRIHHANVVRLIGFCVEGSKRALVYEFMPNGSLDKFIFSKVDNVSLTYQKLFEISLGVARGIAYLHEGCDMQILHFDIKPHNILLDENFIPKVSDFGLAKLYPLDNSIVTLTAARGTIGYMAPELFYQNIGAVSYKADVYSFGMLLMEMASQRRNSNPNAEHSSQFYFPFWIYDQLAKKSDEIEIEILMDEETNKLAKKMFITALWCIQLKPSDRPSMNKVVKMLEGDVASIEMPPRPSYYPNDMIHKDSEINSGVTTSNDSSSCSDFEEEITTNPMWKCFG